MSVNVHAHTYRLKNAEKKRQVQYTCLKNNDNILTITISKSTSLLRKENLNYFLLKSFIFITLPFLFTDFGFFSELLAFTGGLTPVTTPEI